METARLWRSLGHHDAAGTFRIEGITGPDEYSAICDNNVFTNLMAAATWREAADAAARHPDRAADLGVDEEEMAAWRDAADEMAIPYDEELGVHPQRTTSCTTAAGTSPTRRPSSTPLLLSYPYYELYRSQIVKQADLIHALWLCGDRFDEEQKARDFAYYEAITVRDSSLSAAPQAVVAAEVGHVELAYDYFGETAFIDLRDLAGNTHDGLHIAALAGAWLVAVCGFGGMRDHGDTPSFTAPALAAAAPGLPDHVPRPAPGGRDPARRGELHAHGRRGRRRGACHPHHGEGLIAPGTPETRPLPAAAAPPPAAGAAAGPRAAPPPCGGRA